MNDALHLKIEELKAAARKTWHGDEGEKRAAELEKFLISMLAEYSEVLGLPQAEILDAIEKVRDYSVVNFYQRSNFPILKEVSLYRNLADFRQHYPSGRYTCPACSGVSTNPYECDSGIEANGKKCDWKAYGLFGTMGKGLRVAFTEDFLRRPRVDEIFMPVEALQA